VKNTGYFAVVCGSSLFLFVSLWCCAISVYAATCPAHDQYGSINYNHYLRNYSAPAGYIFDQVTTMINPVGINITKTKIVPAGNNKVDKQISQFNSTPQCDCLSQPPAQSMVKVTVTGTCHQGVLNLHIDEVHPESSTSIVCTGDQTCPKSYTQPYPSSTASYDLTIPFVDGATVTQPYTCSNCSGNYSWKLKFTNGPVPFLNMSLVPLISPLILNH